MSHTARNPYPLSWHACFSFAARRGWSRIDFRPFALLCTPCKGLFSPSVFEFCMLESTSEQQLPITGDYYWFGQCGKLGLRPINRFFFSFNDVWGSCGCCISRLRLSFLQLKKRGRRQSKFVSVQTSVFWPTFELSLCLNDESCKGLWY